ncbi:putative linoleate 9S-lipoxygenase 3 [Camellia lanceoleosa]|uniref:Linoleate 9S-lipoxygenase 3 n=1 Tax=Camellia lanceoleosa TaxID=1840588 RepID=A0ACC0IQQ7_9ERIC|nr:putative linoleate 9S-lipoxygenase 3 [Camellia lanceoleosa]
MPNRSTISRRFMPELSTLEYEELESNPEKAFSKTITAMLQTLIGVSLIEILSRHPLDEPEFCNCTTIVQTKYNYATIRVVMYLIHPSEPTRFEAL